MFLPGSGFYSTVVALEVLRTIRSGTVLVTAVCPLAALAVLPPSKKRERPPAGRTVLFLTLVFGDRELFVRFMKACKTVLFVVTVS